MMIQTGLLLCVLSVSGLNGESVDTPPLINKFKNVDSDNVVIINDDESKRSNRFTLDCSARGHPQPNLSWYKDDQLITQDYPGIALDLQTGILDFIAPSLAQHSGYYHCEAENPLGAARSDVIFVTDSVSIPDWAIVPTFKEQPEVEVVEVGKNAKFHCSAETGEPEPEIIWTKNGEVVENSEDPSVLLIENVAPADVGTYACNISNLAGYAYKMVYLNTLTQAPFIIEMPRNKTVSTYQEVILRCRAKGYPAPSVSWLFGGSEITEDDNHVIEDGHLLIKDIRVDNDGAYTCKAINGHGEETAIAYLNVVEQTTITDGPSDTQIQYAQNITMKCTVVWDPNLRLIVSWKKDNLDIGSDHERISVNEDNDLTITDVNFSDSGTYTCVAMTSTGSSTDSGTLTVVGIPPKLVSGPNDLTTTEGETITIPCTVTGFPEPEHVWYGDTERLDLENMDRFSTDESGNLVIESAVSEDSKKYICRAENGYGEPVVTSAFVDIRQKSVMKEPPQDAPFVSGNSAILDCVADVDPSLEETMEVEWSKDDEIVTSDDHIIIYPNASLIISDMVDDDIGEYTCRILTEADQVVGTASIYSTAYFSWIYILLIVLLCLLLLILLICLITCCCRRKKRTGRYGVKDIEGGKKGKKSDIHYNIDDETDSINKDEFLNESTTPIIKHKIDYGKGGSDSLDSLLNLTEEEIWLKRGMDEDGSFREGKYATKD